MNIDQLKKPISDMIYSMIAYALSSVVLTFLIQPMMASIWMEINMDYF